MGVGKAEKKYKGRDRETELKGNDERGEGTLIKMTSSARVVVGDRARGKRLQAHDE